MKGKWIDENIDFLIEEFNNEISKKLDVYYSDVNNIVNPVLSRNIHSSNLFKYFCDYRYDKILPKQVSFLVKLKNIFLYYFKSFFLYFFMLLHGLIFKLFYRKKIKDDYDFIFDTFTMIDKIYPNGFKDNYFDLIYKYLEKENKSFLILSVLFGDRPYNLIKRYRTYKILENNRYDFLSEFELLKIRDYIDILIFIIKYPFYHINTKKNKVMKDELEILYNVTIDETIKDVNFDYYIRYILGKRIGEYFGKINLISWDENQVIHKLLNRGLRETSHKSYIIGTKFFGWTKNWLNLKNLLVEKKHNLSPDKIIVKGEYFKNIFVGFDVQVGVAVRENYLFNLDILEVTHDYKTIGVLFGYDIIENNRIINYLSNISDTVKIICRIHPNHMNNIPYKIPTDWILENNVTLVEFSKKFDIVVSAGTGAALELMCLNKFVLLIGNSDSFTIVTLLDEYKFNNWQIVYEKKEIGKFLQNRNYRKKYIDINYIFAKFSENNIKNFLGV